MNDDAGVNPTASLPEIGAACIAKARSLIPLLQSAADRIEAAGELPPDVLDAMFDAGMFKLLLPRAVGGYELRPIDFIQCVQAIAEGDASVAWCMNQGSGCSMAAAYMAPHIARQIWGSRRDVVAWGQGPGAKAVRAEGGWRVTGTWSFASGSRHATWLGALCPSFEADASPMIRPDGKPWERTFMFRREQARIDDVWQVMGLRGTGSDNFTIEDLFVDDAHSLTREHQPERRQHGPLYSFQAMQLYASGFASVALGVSRAMLDGFIALARRKSQAWSADSLRDNHAVQHIVSYSDAAWKAARAGLHRAVDDAWWDVIRIGVLPVEHRIEIRQAATYAIHVSRDIAHSVFHEAGSTAIFNNRPFERRLRDVNSVSQQLQGRRTHFETVGSFRLGGEPNLRWI
ncbi:acyl-CoA dehydrogenase family protein [Rhodopila sp.]|uniref:acyl-CoA dehydrogenase family protein n=1 Tax=Rhodopila sp. TaxID=2480087 RepID=UPI003D0D579B